MKLLPFDLEKALAGHPVVMRNGTPVREIFLTKEPLENGERIIAVCDMGLVHPLCIHGREYDDETLSKYDLLLALAPAVYMVKFKQPGNEVKYFFDTKQEAQRCSSKYPLDTLIVPLYED